MDGFFTIRKPGLLPITDAVQFVLDRRLSSDLILGDEESPYQSRFRAVPKRWKEEVNLCLLSKLLGAKAKLDKNDIVINELGEVFCTSPVTKSSSKYIQTKNSLYEIELINEEWAEMNYQYDKIGPIH